MQIGILGLGNFGTALADYLASQSFNVIAWSREKEVVNSINSANKNPVYLSQYSLSKNLKATNRIKDLENAEIVLVMLPALALKEVLPNLELKDDCTVISCSKGLATSNRTPLEIIEETLGSKIDSLVLSGPGFAKDIISKKPIGLTLAGEDIKAKEVANLFSSNTMRIYTSNDKLGVEFGGILKNIIAIVVGISDALDFGDSARAGLLTRGLAEIIRFGVAMGAKRDTFVGLSGLGDLVLTATSDKSRNRQFGLALGSGLSVEEALEKIGSTVEGVKSAPKILAMALEKKVEMPLTEALVRVLKNQENVSSIFSNLISRPIRTEIE
ncbi:UNVERIFIED_CONTAM: hypothetical protein GTU68_037006 [Idotea baltica]|nr:hypothetical protein [Idotea baltica]